MIKKNKFEKNQKVIIKKLKLKGKVINYAFLDHLDFFYYLILTEEGKEIYCYEPELEEVKNERN